MVDGADSMKADVSHLNECADMRMFKITDDPRFTPPARFLRRMSIDELPAALQRVARRHVARRATSARARGDGPHPGLASRAPRPDARAHRAMAGHGRNAIPFDEMVKLDYLYVADWSLWNDFKLLLFKRPKRSS